jgi:uncharacterized protein YndB with AHSA1/START domain
LLEALALCCAVQFHAEADIAAPVSDIWELLVDLEGYAAWNPWVVRAEGEVTPGATITADVILLGAVQHVTHDILVVDPELQLCWKDAGWNAWFVDGERCRTLTVNPDGTVHIDNDLVISGALAPIAAWIYGDSLRKGIAAETAALASEAEAP